MAGQKGASTESQPKEVELEVMDYDLVGSDDFLGLATVPRDMLVKHGAHEQALHLRDDPANQRKHRQQQADLDKEARSKNWSEEEIRNELRRIEDDMLSCCVPP